MLIGKFYNGLEIHRENKLIYAKFLNPHRTISTCKVNGGLREDVNCLLNHQACEPNMHFRKTLNSAISDPQQYLASLCKKEKLPAEHTACLSTATNMNHAVIESATYRDIEVIAVATGGVETNAIRVADPASYHETNGRFESIGGNGYASEGTINIMVFISKALIPGAMVSAVLVATEAKTAAMQELSVNSRYSSGLATGTGTDQIGVASSLGADIPLSQADKHSKLGELIGATVKQAVKKTLALHNEYSPPARSRVTVHLERFGITPNEWIGHIAALLPNNHAEVFRHNFEGINRDPLVVAAVAAIIHLYDQLTWGILPANCFTDIMCTYGAQIASAISGNYERLPHYRDCLAFEKVGAEDRVFLEFITTSIGLGYREKWEQ